LWLEVSFTDVPASIAEKYDKIAAVDEQLIPLCERPSLSTKEEKMSWQKKSPCRSQRCELRFRLIVELMVWVEWSNGLV